MNRVATAAVCLAVIGSLDNLCITAHADVDYYKTLAQAEHAADEVQQERAIRVLHAALRKYAGDYQLTMSLAWLQSKHGDYAAAASTYRSAIAISNGALDPRVGLGWTLLLDGECEAAVQVFSDVLREDPNEAAAERGIRTCAEKGRLHGSLWLSLGGSLYHDHAWLRDAEDVLAGVSLRPTGAVVFGLAYHYLTLHARDPRVDGSGQHEVYARTGYSDGHFELTAHAAFVWSGQPNLDGSWHGVLSWRLPQLDVVHSVLQEVAGEVGVSRYPLQWVARLSLSTRLAFGAFSLTPALAAEEVARKALVNGGLTAAFTLGVRSFWIGGQYGREYLVAYLSQFALFNSEDQALWSLTAGARTALDLHWSVFVSYVLMRLESRDGLHSNLNRVSLGTAYTF